MKPALLLLAFATLALLLGWTAQAYIENPDNPQRIPMGQSFTLPVSFAHVDHTGENCLYCHHNYVDDTGQGLCFECHRTDPEVSHLFEEQFHDMCRGCHEDKHLESADHGPTRQCIACHVEDHLP